MKVADVCRGEHRRERVRAIANGIDYVDVGKDRSTLTVHFFNTAPDGLAPEHFHLTGDAAADEIRVRDVTRSARTVDASEKAVDLVLSPAADLARYTLSIDGVSGIDPLYASASFTFAAAHPSALDCADRRVDVPPSGPTPEIDYLAKDYASFRQLMLDRLATTTPAWTERHVPDLGIAIVELLAYVGDYLSYYQDAVATEAYLGTARRRVSIRRHARLVDYAMHEGCNARAFLHVRSSTDRTIDLADSFFITSCRATGYDRTAAIASADLERVPAAEYEVFEPLIAVRQPQRCPVGLARHPTHAEPSAPAQSFEIVAAHSEMRFYTWGSRSCWLREGSTSATLLDEWADDQSPEGDQKKRAGYAGDKRTRRLRRLSPGDILILEERQSPVTGSPADADPTHRHAVRLTSVEPAVDGLYDRDRGGRPVVNITWSDADALPFALCLAALGPAPACRSLGPDPDRDGADLAVALGNVLLVDHGRAVAEAAEPWRGMVGEFEANSALGDLPSVETVATCEGEEQPVFGPELAVPFQPALGRANVTFSVPLSGKPRSAAELVRQDPRHALPQVTLDEGRPRSATVRWSPRVDLLDSDPLDPHFVVEVDDDRVARVRFGRELEAGSSFRAQYRVGNGEAGNVGADAIRHIVSRGGFVTGYGLDIRNPLSAVGGVDPELTSDVRLRAPFAFKTTLERAITADDYARLAERHPQVQRAAAHVAWNGSRESVVVAVDPRGRIDPEPGLLTELKRFLFHYRRIGQDLEVVRAAYVPLALSLRVSVKDGHLRAHVLEALLDAFSNRRLSGAALGFFHPDRLTFGENVYPSQIIATAQRVAGVESVTISMLTRLEDQPEPVQADAVEPGPDLDAHTTAVLRDGVLLLSPFEIARLDNDPGFPERGVLRIDLRGGR